MSEQVFDVIVVGSGAGGSAATFELVQAGLKVCLVEKGEALPRDGSTLDVERVVGRGLFKSHERWRDGKGKLFAPEEYFNLGGKTKWYGAALLRFAPHEFEADPAHQCLGWPIGYAEMAPYYGEIEQLLEVRELPLEPDLSALCARLARPGSGWRVDALPMGLARNIDQHLEEASRYDGFASVLGLKSDAEQALLRRIAKAPNLRLLTGAPVTALLGEPGAPERVTGVRLADGRELRAGCVLLAAGALHSPRLLQRYLEHTGLALRLPVTGQVGRNAKLHLLTAMLALSTSRKTDVLRKTRVLLNDALPHSSIQPLGFDGVLISDLVPRVVPRWLARQIGARAYGFFLQTEDGSHPDNRVTEAPERAASDLAYPTLDYSAERLAPAAAEHRRLIGSFRRALLRAGYVSFSQRIGLGGTAHACGTLAVGKDASSSAVDVEGRVHGMTGLYVVDGSVLPRSSRVNPSLTIYAWGMRVARRLSQRAESYTHTGKTETVGAA